jgi:hypothetical protein
LASEFGITSWTAHKVCGTQIDRRTQHGSRTLNEPPHTKSAVHKVSRI